MSRQCSFCYAQLDEHLWPEGSEDRIDRIALPCQACGQLNPTCADVSSLGRVLRQQLAPLLTMAATLEGARPLEVLANRTQKPTTPLSTSSAAIVTDRSRLTSKSISTNGQIAKDNFVVPVQPVRTSAARMHVNEIERSPVRYSTPQRPKTSTYFRPRSRESNASTFARPASTRPALPLSTNRSFTPLSSAVNGRPAALAAPPKRNGLPTPVQRNSTPVSASVRRPYFIPASHVAVRTHQSDQLMGTRPNQTTSSRVGDTSKSSIQLRKFTYNA
ncbi:hypothetical protein PYCC9005_004439 [Savitreella phatthalungensis]